MEKRFKPKRKTNKTHYALILCVVSFIILISDVMFKDRANPDLFWLSLTVFSGILSMLTNPYEGETKNRITTK